MLGKFPELKIPGDKVWGSDVILSYVVTSCWAGSVSIWHHMRFQAFMTSISSEMNLVIVPEKTAIEANHGSYG